jgi:hypothetical protein
VIDVFAAASIPDEPGVLDRYVAFLEANDEPTDDLHEEGRLRVGGWRFFYRSDGGSRSLVVAIDEDGRTVVEGGWGAWYELLATPELDAAGALERIVWLLGRPMPLDSSASVDEDAADLVADPHLEVDDEHATFIGWISYPPSTRDPHRVSLHAAPDERAELLIEPWSAVR